MENVIDFCIDNVTTPRINWHWLRLIDNVLGTDMAYNSNWQNAGSEDDKPFLNLLHIPHSEVYKKLQKILADYASGVHPSIIIVLRTPILHNRRFYDLLKDSDYVICLIIDNGEYQYSTSIVGLGKVDNFCEIFNGYGLILNKGLTILNC